MNSRQRNVLIRMILAVGVFAYVGYLAWQQLPPFDFKVIASFVVLYLSWAILSETVIYKDPGDFVIEDDDRRSYLYLQLSFLIALFYATIDFVEYHFTRMIAAEPYIIFIGFSLFIISCGIRWWGFNSIGPYFNPRVAVYQNHQLITSGAYRNIRHPLYLGSLISFMAIPVIFSSWGALLIMVLATIPALVYRIRVEEEFLLQYFGDSYREYMQHTSRLIPGIW